MAKERVGFIFECGRAGPDYHVCRHLLGRLNPGIEMQARFLDHTEQLLSGCGEVAALLLQTCTRVVIVWDLEPAWDRNRRCCRHNDKEKAFQSLKAAGVPKSKALLLCIERELESWLLADLRALKALLAILKHPHPVGRLPNRRRPDNVRRPKTVLISSLFQHETGRKYEDRAHALRIAENIVDWSRLKHSASFRRFAEHVARVSI